MGSGCLMGVCGRVFFCVMKCLRAREGGGNTKGSKYHCIVHFTIAKFTYSEMPVFLQIWILSRAPKIQA
jgi:hypothetical protein